MFAMGQLFLVQARFVVLLDRARLRVNDRCAIRTGIPSFLKDIGDFMIYAVRDIWNLEIGLSVFKD